MKRILVFGMTDNPGGMESCIMNYYRFIDRTKIQFDFLCNFDTMAHYDEVIKLGGNVFFIPKRSESLIKYKKELEAFFKTHAKDYYALWFNTCSLANIDYLKIAKRYDIKIRIVHAHNSQNMDSKLRGVLHNLNRNIVSKYATDFWSCSREASLFFYNSNIINSSKYSIVKNAINLTKYAYNREIREEYREELGLQDKLVIGNVGRLHFQKNHLFLIDIFKEITLRNNNAILLLVGKGPDEEVIKEKVEKCHLEDKVIFLGLRNDVENIMQAMDIFLLPSLFEGLPLVLIEAQASGLQSYASKDVISIESKASDFLRFIGLDKSAYVWADKILNYHNENNLKREDSHSIILNSGFDIEKEAKKMEKFFEV